MADTSPPDGSSARHDLEPNTFLSAGIEIAAPAERVWAILTDFVRYRDWNPFIRAIEGEARRRSRLVMILEPPGRPQVTVRTRLTTLQHRRELSWVGQILAPGLLDGEHRLSLERIDSQTTRVVQSERFSGVLAPFLAPGLIGSTEAGLEAMNRALKERAETR